MGSIKAAMWVTALLFNETYKHTPDWRVSLGLRVHTVFILYCRCLRSGLNPTVSLAGDRRAGLWHGNPSGQELWLLCFWLFNIVSTGPCQALGETLANEKSLYPSRTPVLHTFWRPLGSLHTDCPALTSVAMTTLAKLIWWGRVYAAYNSMSWSLVSRKSRQDLEVAINIIFAVREEWMHAYFLMPWTSLNLHNSGPNPREWMVLPTFRLHIPSSISIIKTISHSHTHHGRMYHIDSSSDSRLCQVDNWNYGRDQEIKPFPSSVKSPGPQMPQGPLCLGHSWVSPAPSA